MANKYTSWPAVKLQATFRAELDDELQDAFNDLGPRICELDDRFERPSDIVRECVRIALPLLAQECGLTQSPLREDHSTPHEQLVREAEELALGARELLLLSGSSSFLGSVLGITKALTIQPQLIRCQARLMQAVKNEELTHSQRERVVAALDDIVGLPDELEALTAE